MADLDNQVVGSKKHEASEVDAELGMVQPDSPQVGNSGVEAAVAGPDANVPVTTETESANPPVDVKLEPTVPPEGVEVRSKEQEVGSKELGATEGTVRSKEQGEGGGEGQAANGVAPTDSEVVPPETMKEMVARISSTEGASVAGAMGVEEEIRAQREAGGQVSANE